MQQGALQPLCGPPGEGAPPTRRAVSIGTASSVRLVGDGPRGSAARVGVRSPSWPAAAPHGHQPRLRRQDFQGTSLPLVPHLWDHHHHAGLREEVTHFLRARGRRGQAEWGVGGDPVETAEPGAASVCVLGPGAQHCHVTVLKVPSVRLTEQQRGDTDSVLKVGARQGALELSCHEAFCEAGMTGAGSGCPFRTWRAQGVCVGGGVVRWGRWEPCVNHLGLKLFVHHTGHSDRC